MRACREDVGVGHRIGCKQLEADCPGSLAIFLKRFERTSWFARNFRANARRAVAGSHRHPTSVREPADRYDSQNDLVSGKPGAVHALAVVARAVRIAQGKRPNKPKPEQEHRQDRRRYASPCHRSA